MERTLIWYPTFAQLVERTENLSLMRNENMRKQNLHDIDCDIVSSVCLAQFLDFCGKYHIPSQAQLCHAMPCTDWILIIRQISIYMATKNRRRCLLCVIHEIEHKAGEKKIIPSIILYIYSIVRNPVLTFNMTILWIL